MLPKNNETRSLITVHSQPSFAVKSALQTVTSDDDSGIEGFVVLNRSNRVSSPSKNHYVSAGGFVRGLTVCLVVQMAIAAYIAWEQPPQVYLIPRSTADMAFVEGKWEQHYTRLIAWCNMIAGMTAVTFFFPCLIWANKNARAMGANDMLAKPGWMIGCFVIPILNLWTPWKPLQELWRASVPAAGDWKQTPGWWLITVWCLHRVLDIGVGQTVWLWQRWYPTEPMIWLINVDVSTLFVIAQLLHIIQNLLTIVMIRGLHRRQEERYALFGEAPPSTADRDLPSGRLATDLASCSNPSSVMA